MTANATVGKSATYLSEIFPLTISKPNLMCFRLTPEVDREDGNRLSLHLSLRLPNTVVTWHQGYFYALGTPKFPMWLLAEDWQDILAQVVEQGLTDFSDRFWQFHEVPLSRPVPPTVFSQLAAMVLKTTAPYPFTSPVALSKNGVQVRREVKFWAETIELKGDLQPALTLTIKSKFLLSKNLAEFYLNYPDKLNDEKLLIGLNVRSLSGDLPGNGTITKLVVEPTLEHKQLLIDQAKSEISKQALQEPLSDKLLVAVKFNKNKKLYEYGMAALHPIVTNETAIRFGVDWGELLKETKIPYEKRKDLLVSYKHQAGQALSVYGFELAKRSINSRDYPELFLQPSVELGTIPLRFGGGVTCIQKTSPETLKAFPLKRFSVIQTLIKFGLFIRLDDVLSQLPLI